MSDVGADRTPDLKHLPTVIDRLMRPWVEAVNGSSSGMGPMVATEAFGTAQSIDRRVVVKPAISKALTEAGVTSDALARKLDGKGAATQGRKAALTALTALMDVLRSAAPSASARAGVVIVAAAMRAPPSAGDDPIGRYIRRVPADDWSAARGQHPMPLMQHADCSAFLLHAEPEIIGFAMMSGGLEVGVELPIAVMLVEFGASRLAPLDHFASHRTVIEGTASHAYDRLAIPNDRLRMGGADFETKGSRAHTSVARVA